MSPMAYDLVIRNARLASGEPIDVAIEGGNIAAVGSFSASIETRETLDAGGLTIGPGLIDTQVHFREPGLEHKEDLKTGSMAAIAGGVTTFFEMPNTDPTTTTREALEDKLARARGRCYADFAFFVGATTENAATLAELEMAPGAAGIKIFMGSSTGPLLVASDDDLRPVLRAGVRPCPIHAEDEPRNRARKLEFENPRVQDHPLIRDEESARLATERILALSRETGRPVHILHLSTRDELPMIAAAKAAGLPVTAEVTPQHLFFHAPDCYDRIGSRAQMNPPIRSIEHRDGIRQALRDGLFDVFGSDHAPHTLEEKARAYPLSPSGMPGVQTMLPALLRFAQEGLIDLVKLFRMGAERPASLYGIRGKGRIAAGYDADLVLVDPQATRVMRDTDMLSKCGWTPYDGETLGDFPRYVFLRGTLVAREGKIVGEPIGQAVGFDWK